MDPRAFFTRELPARLTETGSRAGRAAVRAGLPPLTIDVEGEPWTLVPEPDGLEIAEGGRAGGIRARLDRTAFSSLVDDHKSTLGLSVAGRVEVAGDGGCFVSWDPILRAAIDGREPFEPGSIDLGDVDLAHRFAPDDAPADMRAFLTTAGFLCVESVFRRDEMAAVSNDLDRALSDAAPDDGTSWWVRTNTGEHRPSRILNFLRQSPSLQRLVGDARFLRMGAIPGEGHVHSDSFGEHFAEPSAEGLIKPVGVREGISDLGWHKDCARGGHSRFCCGLTVGIAVTGADEETGELRVVAGSHRSNLPAAGLSDDVDLPVVALPTRAGDVTIHCSCTLHEARPPRLRERKVVYTGFGLPPRFADDDAPTSSDALARERADIGKMS